MATTTISTTNIIQMTVNDNDYNSHFEVSLFFLLFLWLQYMWEIDRKKGDKIIIIIINDHCTEKRIINKQNQNPLLVSILMMFIMIKNHI